ncbi:histidine kinase [Thermodesulfatator indicus DSM 15286]|uniref:histidine kinase n=1 Tax=Thermodesulfatator indicus (strain DSM 15286 / JCM 11887 / CIR29812) TaxID=667014 RepID=F8AAK5_THEID|nr:PAS domain-containing sensor histidine kinase [Thermodesulfatator indicus]AEH44277.1 histidine kinase [Thermodesulfatator indicus DSM 15286]
MDTGLKINLFLSLVLIASWIYFVIKWRKRPISKETPPPKSSKPESKREISWPKIFDILEEGVVICKKDGSIVFLNPKAYSFLGVGRPNELPNLFDILRDPNIQQAIEKGEGRSFEKELFWPAYRVFKITTLAIDDALRALVFLDLTPFRKLSHIRRDFVAHLAHEFRTPLTAIEGYAEALLEEVPGDMRQDVSIIIKNTKRLSRLLKELQVLSRLELQGIPEEDFEVVDLKEVIQTAIETISIKAQNKKIIVHWKFPEQSVPVWGSFDDLLRAFINLLDNAIKFSPSGKNIWIVLEEKEKEWQVSIKDEGPGIKDYEKERIFERFYRGKDVKEAGTGLGLAIVKHVIQAHKGKIKVESSIGKGSEFIVKLPKHSPPQRKTS